MSIRRYVHVLVHLFCDEKETTQEIWSEGKEKTKQKTTRNKSRDQNTPVFFLFLFFRFFAYFRLPDQHDSHLKCIAYWNVRRKDKQRYKHKTQTKHISMHSHHLCPIWGLPLSNWRTHTKQQQQQQKVSKSKTIFDELSNHFIFHFFHRIPFPITFAWTWALSTKG